MLSTKSDTNGKPRDQGPVPDLEQAKRHVELLTGSPDTSVHIRLIHDLHKGDGRKLFGSITDVWSQIEAAQAQGYGAFIVVNEGGQSDAEITRVRAAFIDGDEIQTPDDWEWHAPPRFFVRRDDSHWHAYWPVADLAVHDFKVAQQRLSARYSTDRTVCNPSRVMRLAGSIHRKDPANPYLMRLEDRTDLAAGASTSADALLAGLPAQSLKAQAAKDNVVRLPQGDRRHMNPVSVATYRKVLSWIDPTFKGDRNTFVGIARCILDEDVPLKEGEEQPDAVTLADSWARGDLWRERTGDDSFAVETYRYDHVDDFLNDVRPSRPGGSRIGWGTLVRYANASGFTGRLDDRPAREVFAAYVEQEGVATADAPRPANDHPPVSRFVLRSEAMQDARPPITWLIDGLIQDPSTVVIHAPWNSFKSFAALDIGLAVASGERAFGHLSVNRVGPVIYLAGEGVAGIETARRPAWRAARGIAAGRALPFYTVERVPQAAKAEDVEACMQMVRDAIAGRRIERPVMIIIDTMARAMAGLNENDAGDATRYLDLAEGLKAEFGCTVLTVAHEGKDGDRGLRGSSAFGGGFDIILKMDADTEGLTATISSPKVKDGSPIEPFALHGKEHHLSDGRKSLVFDWADRSDFHGTKAKTVTSQDVGAALKALRAEKGLTVTTENLACYLVGEYAADEKMVKAKVKALQRGQDGRLMAYVAHKGQGRGDSTLWTLPQPTQDAAND